jgi:hypothetical protein
MNSFNKLVILSFIALVLYGCEKNTEVKKYSCNNHINDWVSENLNEIKNMDRSNLLEYSLEYQKPIFRAFSPQQRYNSWNEKLNEVLKLNWDKEERLHILLLRSQMSLNWFIEGNTQEHRASIDKRNQWINDWISEAVTDLGWSLGLIHSMVVVMETNVSDNGYLLESYRNDENSKNYKVSDEGDCGCSQTSDWCDIPGTGSDNGSCQPDGCIVGTGCGFVWSYDCDGNCKIGIIGDE